MLFVGSGNVVHNLPGIQWSLAEEGFDWAHRFDDAARELMTTAPGDIAALGGHPDFANAVPTPDHFLPLLYVAGLAAARGQAGRRVGGRLRLRLAVDDGLHDRRRRGDHARRTGIPRDQRPVAR